MAGLNVEYINPFLAAATSVLHDFGIETKIGKPLVKKEVTFEKNALIIMIGVTGEMKGQVMIAFGNEVACEVSSKMMMMPVTEMNEISTSAICELGNMILGNAATIFSNKGIGIDITPPTMCSGNVVFSTSYAANVGIPLTIHDGKSIELNVSIKGE
ncbi:MAG: chemotaxis protein CheX [Lachnospiraceae bacterium]|nr:chemotaxis protein CheX [Lachnospiraceae bacterium]